jgi:hypothetical protein
MNDNELITAVRESVVGVYSATPVEQIISRGRAVRARRAIPAVSGVLAVAVGTTLVVTTLLPASHPGGLAAGHQAAASVQPGSHSASVRLTAWTVARQANGDIDVTINQLRNPAGLQNTLRADGLPVNITFSGPLSSAPCQPYNGGLGSLRTVTHWQTSGGSAVLVINPSALPSGIGLAIFDEPGQGLPTLNPDTPTLGKGPGKPSALRSIVALTDGPLAVGLVQASQQCTG